MMNKPTFFFSLLLMTSISFAEVYKWTDSQGMVHFSDKPHAGSEEINLPESQVYSSPMPTKNSDSTENNNDSSTNDEPKDKDHQYSNIAITQPSNDSTIRDNEGMVIVSIKVTPNLARGDRVQIIFDGGPMGDPQTETVFQLKGIYRGSHTIAAQVVGSDDAVLATSEKITIFMQPPRVGMNPNR